jgi:hypothetical protein
MKENNKEFKTYYRNEKSITNIMEYDGYAPDGIKNIQGETIIEIKSYTTKSSVAWLAHKEKFFNRLLNDNLDIKNILLIITLELQEQYKDKMEKKLNKLIDNINVKIYLWDINDI